jgi:hypothetical protein
LWERPAQDLLASELGVAPLAMLGRLPEGVPEPQALTDLVQRLIERLERGAAPDQVRRLLTAAFVLTEMRLSGQGAWDVFRGVRAMREYATYAAILDEGREDQMKKVILRTGQKRFGPADESIVTRLNAIRDLERLDKLFDRALEVSSWEEVFNTP